MATFPGNGTIAGPNTYPGGDVPFSVTQSSPTSVTAAWASIFANQDMSNVKQVKLTYSLTAFAEGEIGAGDVAFDQLQVEEMIVTGVKHVEVTNLYPGMAWAFKLAVAYKDSPNHRDSYVASIRLDPLQQNLQLGTDGWQSTSSQDNLQSGLGGSRTTFKRVIRRSALGITQNRIEKEVRYLGSYSGSASIIRRRFANLKRGWRHQLSITMERMRESKVPGYKIEIYTVKRVRGVDILTLLKGSTATYSVEPGGGILPPIGATGFNFVPKTKVVELRVTPLNSNGNVNVNDLMESVAITNFELREDELDNNYRTSYPATDDDGNPLLYTVGATRQINDMVSDGSLASYLDVTCNSVGYAWYIDNAGQLQFAGVADDPAQPVLYLADSNGPGKISFLSYEMTRDTQELVNDLSITNHRVGIKVLSTDYWAADDQTIVFQNKPSIKKYGTRSASVEWALLDRGDIIKMRADEVFEHYAQLRGKQIVSVTCNIQSSPASLFAVKQFAKIWVELDGRVQESKVIKIKRDIGPEQGLITFDLLPLRNFMVSETFAEFDLYEQATTFADFNAIPMAPTFKGFNKTRKYHG